MAGFVYLSQVLDGEERVIKVPETALSTWLPRGWAPCDPPAPKRRPVKPAEAPADPPAVASASARPAPTPKKSERSTSGRELKSEDNV